MEFRKGIRCQGWLFRLRHVYTRLNDITPVRCLPCSFFAVMPTYQLAAIVIPWCIVRGIYNVTHAGFSASTGVNETMPTALHYFSLINFLFLFQVSRDE